MDTIIAFLLAITAPIAGLFGTHDQNLGAFGDPFISRQLATGADAGECLTTDGTNNSWGSCGTGGGSFSWTPTTYNGSGVNATSTGIWFKGSPLSVIASSTFSTYATTTSLGVTSVYAVDSAGIDIHSSNGTAIVTLGAGGGSNVTFSGGVNIDGTTRLATGLTGILKASSGTVSVATAGTDYENALTFTYPLTRSTNTISLAFGTTTSNTWAGTQTFTNNPVLGTLTGLVAGNNGVLYQVASSSLFGFTPASNATTITVAGTANQITSSAGAQDLSANRTWTLSLPDHVIFPANFQATNSTTTNATTTGTLYVTGTFASTTNFYANGLANCSTNNVLTWTNGVFGCETDDASTGNPYEIATTSTIAQSQLAYFTQASGRTTVGGVATSSITLTSFPANMSGTLGNLVGGSTATWTWWGFATTSQPSSSNLLVSNGTNGVYGVATTAPTATYPLQYSGTLGAFVGGAGGAFSLAFGTTTSNTWANTQTFTNSPVFTSLTGGLVSSNATSDTIYNTSTTTLTLPSSAPFNTSGTIGNLVGGTNFTLGYYGIATSAAIANTEVIYGTAVNTVDSEAAFAYNATADRLTLSFASSTAISGTNENWSGISRFARGIVTGIAAAFTSAIEGEFGFDTTYNDFEYFAGSAARVVSPVEYGKFNISTTTTWTGTTTAYKIGPAPRNITMTKWWCKTDAGFLAVQFSDGTNRTDYVVASSTVGTTTLSTNNTWVQGEDMVLEVGTTTTASTKNIGCTYAYTFADS